MKDLGKGFCVLDVEIRHDRSRGILCLPQKACVECMLKRFNMENCSPSKALIGKGDRLNKKQYVKKLLNLSCGELAISVISREFDVHSSIKLNLALDVIVLGRGQI